MENQFMTLRQDRCEMVLTGRIDSAVAFKKYGVCLLLSTLLLGCSSSLYRAPVEDRMADSRPAGGATALPEPGAAISNPSTTTVTSARSQPLGVENLGKPGYYEVKAGDTLIHVALENGQNWRDLVKWNDLENPNTIEMGQVIRVLPPSADPAAVTSKPVAVAKLETRSLDAVSAAVAVPPKAPASAVTSSVASAVQPVASAPRGEFTTKDAINEAEGSVSWAWPSTGPVTAPFSEGKVKGVAISGKLGDPVLAAADGKVVYAGSGLRGYGNLIILKHNSIYLTAYAHNQTLLVKEDQPVRRGQKIAEMGATDADGVRLHFEVRKQGKPVDPVRLLPQR
jgi:lipoprotein NlpD